MIRFKIIWYGILLTLFFVPGTLVCQMTDGVVLAPNNSPSFSPTGPDAAENGEAQNRFGFYPNPGACSRCWAHMVNAFLSIPLPSWLWFRLPLDRSQLARKMQRHSICG